jgi:hypothetical protein
LKEYKDINGHCNVPQNYEVNKDLANWVGRQRTEWRKFRDGKRAQITADRIALLDGLGFQWSPQEQKWSERLEELKDCSVPSNYEANKDLANWVRWQREEWKKFRGGKSAQITADRIALLDGLGFQWSPQRRQRGVMTRRQ